MSNRLTDNARQYNDVLYNANSDAGKRHFRVFDRRKDFNLKLFILNSLQPEQIAIENLYSF